MYPETVLATERWLDASSGRASVHAAVLRAADGRGYARGSDWCPGLDNTAHASSAFADDADAAASPVLLQGGAAALHHTEAPASSAASSRDAGAAPSWKIQFPFRLHLPTL